MTVEALPWAIQGQSHNATVARNAVAALMGAPSAALTAAAQITTAGGSHGVVLSGDLAVTQNGSPNMSVNVAAGRCFVRSQETLSLGHGTYTGFNDATLNVAVAASDPTNPRRDLVVFQVRDSNYSGASTDARITVVTGTPAASPVDPAVPVSSLVLARITVAAASSTVVNANITDLRTRAYALGGVAVCTSTTRPTGASLYAGLEIYETDTASVLIYDGTGWIILAEPPASYTCTWSSSGTAPTLGNGTLTATRSRANGNCTVAISLTIGSTSTMGTGNYRFSMPVAPFATSRSAIGSAHARNSAGSSFFFGLVFVEGGPYLVAAAAGLTANQFWGAGSPLALATGDIYTLDVTYRMTTRYS